MNCAEKVIIACFLLVEGAEQEGISAFVTAVEAGCALGEPDAFELREAFLLRARMDLPDGDMGGIIRMMLAKIELDVIYRDYDLRISNMREIERLVASAPQNEIAARVIVRKVQDVIRMM